MRVGCRAETTRDYLRCPNRSCRNSERHLTQHATIRFESGGLNLRFDFGMNAEHVLPIECDPILGGRLNARSTDTGFPIHQGAVAVERDDHTNEGRR